MTHAKTKVLVVDDSALMRQLISTILAGDPGIEVVGTAADPLIAREKIKAFNPDVVTLDIEMPRMDGIEFLRRLMTLRPTRVLMISSLTKRNADETLRALQLGAVDCLEKPVDASDGAMAPFRHALLEKIHLVASARLRSMTPAASAGSPRKMRVQPGSSGILAIGASTGGVEALTYLLQELPLGLPPIMIVQHMPPRFTSSFAQRLDGVCALGIREAEDGMEVVSGQAVIAPGGFQLEAGRKGSGYFCKVFEGDPVSGHAPSVDVLFRSVANLAGQHAIGVILTGMGQDGAQGLLEMRQAGARTIGQDQSTSLVYGMPRAAAELGAVESQLTLDRIPDAIVAAAEAGGRPPVGLSHRNA